MEIVLRARRAWPTAALIAASSGSVACGANQPCAAANARKAATLGRPLSRERAMSRSESRRRERWRERVTQSHLGTARPDSACSGIADLGMKDAAFAPLPFYIWQITPSAQTCGRDLCVKAAYSIVKYAAPLRERRHQLPWSRSRDLSHMATLDGTSQKVVRHRRVPAQETADGCTENIVSIAGNHVPGVGNTINLEARQDSSQLLDT